jgi:hypothetical protein
VCPEWKECAHILPNVFVVCDLPAKTNAGAI